MTSRKSAPRTYPTASAALSGATQTISRNIAPRIRQRPHAALSDTTQAPADNYGFRDCLAPATSTGGTLWPLRYLNAPRRNSVVDGTTYAEAVTGGASGLNSRIQSRPTLGEGIPNNLAMGVCTLSTATVSTMVCGGPVVAVRAPVESAALGVRGGARQVVHSNDVAGRTLEPTSSNVCSQPVAFNLREVRDSLVDRVSGVSSLAELEGVAGEIADFFREGLGVRPRPNASARRRYPVGNGDSSVEDDYVVCATRVQRGYRRNRRRAVREVIQGVPARCPLSSEEIFRAFSTMSGGASDVSTADEEEDSQEAPEVPDELQQLLTRPFTAAEVSRRLKRAHNSAPGPDGVPYKVLRERDPGCQLLARFFCACQRLEAVPELWKVSLTVLVPKKGDGRDIGNWRPIALGNTLPKLFAAVLADRLIRFATRGQCLSPAQKGFLSFEGCQENNFVLGQIMEDSSRRGRDLIVAWLDLSDAFGSIPHRVVYRALRRRGVDPAVIRLYRSLNTGCYTRIRTERGVTGPIAFRRGVKQGCPSSPVLFDFAVDSLLEALDRLSGGYELAGVTHRCLAYADDLCLIASSVEEMSLLLRAVQEAAVELGLRFNPKKCATAHFSGRGCRRTAVASTFRVGGEPLRCLGEGEAYFYLGVPSGLHVRQTPDATLAGMGEHLRALDASLLAPWQKMDAWRTFIMPRLDYVFRSGVVERSPLTELDREVKRTVKRWMGLPQRASAELLYVPTWRGGAGLVPLADLADVLLLAQAFRMLTCGDASVAALARQSLWAAVQRRTRRPPARDEVAEYLSGSLAGAFARDQQGDPGFWTRVRMASRRQAKRLRLEWRPDAASDGLVLVCRGSDDRTVRLPPEARAQVVRRLRGAVQEHYLSSLLSKPDQGKVYRVSSRNRASNAFIRAGQFTRFAEWRFVHRARLDVLPVNGARRWRSDDRRCRRCGYHNETLPHVLCHCLPHSAAMQRRHNAIVDRLAKASRCSGALAVNSRVGGVLGELSALRPDIVVRDEATRRITIVDVTVAFENREEAFEAARRDKVVKYTPLAEALFAAGYDVWVDAFVVGALGSWDWGNEAVLRRLGVSRRYASLMRRLIVSDTIRWSRDIYVEHMSGIRQYLDANMPESDAAPAVPLPSHCPPGATPPPALPGLSPAPSGL